MGAQEPPPFVRTARRSRYEVTDFPVVSVGRSYISKGLRIPGVWWSTNIGVTVFTDSVHVSEERGKEGWGQFVGGWVKMREGQWLVLSLDDGLHCVWLVQSSVVPWLDGHLQNGGGVPV